MQAKVTDHFAFVRNAVTVVDILCSSRCAHQHLHLKILCDCWIRDKGKETHEKIVR